jgi:hypothetical protein
VEHHILGIDNPLRAWEFLHLKVNMASNEICHLQLAASFMDALPITSKSMEEWYYRLNCMRWRLHNTEATISDVTFKNRLKRYLPVRLKGHYTSLEVVNMPLEQMIYILV